MKKLTFLTISLLAALLPVSGAAQDGAWMWRLRPSLIDYDQLSATLPGLAGELELDSPLGLSGDLTRMMTPHFGIETMLAATWNDQSLCTDSECLDGGTMWIMPFSVSLTYHPMLMGDYHPYLSVGIAWTMLTNPGSLDTLREYGIDSIEYEGNLGFTIAAGMSYDLGDPWLVNLDLRYLDSPVDVEVGYVGLDRIDHLELDIDPWIIGLGVGCRF